MASLSYAEIANYSSRNEFDPEIMVLKEKESLNKSKYRSRKEIFEDIYRGGMPEYIVSNKDRNSFFSSYIETYLEKDITGQVGVDNIPTFLRFMQYIALRTGCPVDYADIGELTRQLNNRASGLYIGE